MIQEGDKVRLTTGEIARISEILGGGAAYIAEIYRKSDDFGITIDTVKSDDIRSVFVETEKLLAPAV